MVVPTSERPVEEEGAAHRTSRRRQNERRARAADTPSDAQGLVEFACECTSSECERSVKMPLHVYRRMVESGDQYLLQAGHHAFARHRTIISVGMMRIEERA